MASLDEVNTARAEEVCLKAAALQSCLDHDEAMRLATAAGERLGEARLLIDESATDAVCHEVWVETEPSWITIVGRS